MNLFLIDAYEAAKRAQKVILEVYQQPFSVEQKEDHSPVTEADKRADDVISSYLKERYPDFGFLTEETDDDLIRLEKDYVWVVDPVDGTKDFVAKNDEFTINIALVYRHRVIAGLIMIPVTGETYYASEGHGAFYRHQGPDQRIHVNDKTKDLTVLMSRFHSKANELAVMDRYAHVITKRAAFGSAIKACKIAQGLAEITYRLSEGTKEWDTAASDILITEAGGHFIKPDGTRYTYNRPDVRNLEGYVIVNRLENVYL